VRNVSPECHACVTGLVDQKRFCHQFGLAVDHPPVEFTAAASRSELRLINLAYSPSFRFT